jgi:ATP-dependent RNA helicase DDX18/HAS1
MQRIIELIRNETIPAAPTRAPYLVIITPTTELANQVGRVVRELAHVLKFRSSCVTSASDMDAEQRKLRLGVEVLIATPGRLLALITRKEITMERVQTVVLDEADVLFMDQSFPLQPIGAACPLSSQFIFTTATLPDIVVKQIVAEFPNIKELKGPGLHRIAPTVEEVLIDCSGPATQQKNADTAFENKRLALLRALEQTEVDRTLVFCNTIPQCRQVENALQRADRNNRIRNVYAYHGAIDFKTREENIEMFSKPLLKLPAVLVCTDRASRGMVSTKLYS